MPGIILIFFTIVLYSCQGQSNQDKQQLRDTTGTNTGIAVTEQQDTSAAKPGTGKEKSDVMLDEDIRFNGKLKRFFTISEFETAFGKPDSMKLLTDEAPCFTIFETEAPDDKYLYKNGSRFETSGDSVAVDEFWFSNGNFITYKGIRIDAYTTMQDIQQLFPTAVKGRLGMGKEGKLWVIQLKEDEKGISDGHIKMFFRNGKVSFMHWWFPC